MNSMPDVPRRRPDVHPEALRLLAELRDVLKALEGGRIEQPGRRPIVISRDLLLDALRVNIEILHVLNGGRPVAPYRRSRAELVSRVILEDLMRRHGGPPPSRDYVVVVDQVLLELERRGG